MNQSLRNSPRRALGKGVRFSAALVVLLAVLASEAVCADPVAGVWSSYTWIPDAKVTDGNAPAGLKVGISTLQTGAAFPLSFAGCRTMLLNKISYQVMDLRHSGAEGSPTPVDRVQSVSYTLFLIQQLSERWQLVAVATPGLVGGLGLEIGRGAAGEPSPGILDDLSTAA
jgi:hypothetical protein